jgi:hypothetical protein
MKGLVTGAALAALFALSACVERAVTAPEAQLNADPDQASGKILSDMRCTVSANTPMTCVDAKTVAAAALTPGGASTSRLPGEPGGTDHVIIGGQNLYLTLTASNTDWQAAQVTTDVTIQNLLNEAIGTPDGITPDPQGIQVFFHELPTVTSGTGTVSVDNSDGFGFFTAANQPYFAYPEILDKDEVSSAKTWRFVKDAGVNSFSFKVYVETDVQPLLVINEVMANPAGTTADQFGDWVELYNAGTLKVDLQGLVVADSAASGRRPYHLIASSVVIQPGGYAVLGNTTNTTTNLGVPVDYSLGGSIQLQSSLDAFKIARVYGSDTLTIDRTQYANAAVSAKDGVSRELKNPALDNSNMDGSNWGDASVTSVYGVGGRGTPRAQNSAYTP